MHKVADTTKKRERPGETRSDVGGSLSPRAMEEYDQLKQSIISLMPEVERRVLLFTSATEGEGTSSTVANFGIFLESAGERPLLVDANLRNPVLHEIFALDKTPGVAELLSGRETLERVIRPTRFLDLLLVTAGSLQGNPFSLLSDPRIDSVFQQMKAASTWVLIDTPAVNMFNDAVALGSRTDGVVLVVRAEKTRWEVARNARQRLENGKANIIGAVLNDRRLHIPEWIYGRL